METIDGNGNPIDSQFFSCSILYIYNAFGRNNGPLGAGRVTMTDSVLQNHQKNKIDDNSPVIS